MIELYLIRHGIAAERNDYTNDEIRPLTDKGRQKTQQVAQRLDEIGLRFDIILTSPLVRAHQTAEILLNASLSNQMEEFASLAPEGDIKDLINWISKSRYNRQGSSIALVGHQPDLGNWAETLIWGSANDKLILKKAGIIGLTLPNTETSIGNSEIFLLLSPKWLL